MNTPHDLEVERCILGAILIDKEILPRVAPKINVNAFHSNAHQRIYKAILSLYTKKHDVDILSIKNELPQIRGPEVTPLDLTDLTNGITSTGNIDTWVRIVSEKHISRIIISDYTSIVNQVVNESSSLGEVINDIDHVGEKIRGYKRKIVGYNSLDQISHSVSESINTTSGIIPTGIPYIDRKLRGLTRRSIGSVLARPGHMKSTFSDFLCTSIVKQGYKGLIISLEDPTEQRIKRIIASELSLSLNDMRFQKIVVTKEEILKVLTTTLSNNLYVVDSREVLKPADAASVISDIQPDFVVVDHIQKFEMDDMILGLIRAVRSLETSAIRNNCHILITSQVSDKKFEFRDANAQTPTASDAQWTSALYQSSSEMFSLYYAYAINHDPFSQNMLELKILKGRYSGGLGKCNLQINPDQAKIEGEYEIQS